jgi:hypothetical protein
MNFDEWLKSDEGVVRFGMELRKEYVFAARIAWDAAIESAAKIVEDRYDECEPWITPDDIRNLSSN